MKQKLKYLLPGEATCVSCFVLFFSPQADRRLKPVLVLDFLLVNQGPQPVSPSALSARSRGSEPGWLVGFVR